MLDVITPSRLDKLRKRLVQVSRAGVARPAVPRDALAEAARAVRSRARKTLKAAIEHAGGIYLADRLHACASRPRSCATRSRSSAS